MPAGELSALETELGYDFKNKALLRLALTHSSYANESGLGRGGSNERTEFLGDAVLELVISRYIFDLFSDMPEGELTKLRAGIVCEPTIAARARALELNKYILLGKGEENNRENMRDSILADAFEAVAGAIYLDGGFEAATRFLLKELASSVEEIKDNFRSRDFKTSLQELVQKKNPRNVVSYKITGERGPDHMKVFAACALINGHPLGMGEGRSKKEAEQSAAKDALEKF
ncbi:MAG: ribonuclease III [Firmicutes bacterium]|nr:ribonuclease III [Bacillota bacterium]